MPNPDISEESKIYVAKTSEQIEEKEGLTGINTIEEQSDSYAVANTESGGNKDLNEGLDIMNTNASENINNSSVGFSENLNGSSETSSGELSDTNSSAKTEQLEEDLSGGEGEGIFTGNGNGADDGKASLGSKSDELSGDLAVAADNVQMPEEASRAKALLESIVKETHLDEGRTENKSDDGDLSSLKDSGSDGDLSSISGGDIELSGKSDGLNSSNGSESSESKPKTDTEVEVKMLDSMSQLVEDSQKADAKAEEDAAEFNAGFAEGQMVGRSVGYGQIMSLSEGQMTFKSFKEAGFDNSGAYSAAKYAELTAKSSKFLSGYNVGYNNGFAEGKRLLLEVARKKQEQREQDPNYQEGKRMGIEAGTKSISKEADDKSRSAALLAEANTYKPDPAVPKDADPSADALKNKGFFAGYNLGRVEAKKAEIEAKKAETAALLNNPEYRLGYDFGYNLGLNGMSAAQREERDRLMNAKDANGERTLAAKGVAAGYNKGAGDKMKADQALRAQQEKALKNDDHYLMGTITGTVCAALKIEGFADFSKEKAIQLIIENKLSAQLNNPIKISDKNLELFKTKKLHLSMSSEQKSKFDKGYFVSYNKGTVDIKQKIQKQEDALNTGGDSYNRGKTLGEVAGSAASIRDELKRKAAKLLAARLEENPENQSPTGEESALLSKVEIIEQNISKIRLAVGEIDDSSYKRGFYENYTKAYNKENTDRSKAKATLKTNQRGAAAGGQNSSEYQQGLTNGRKMGEMVFNIRRLPLTEQGDLNSKIKTVFEEAKSKGADFESGFMLGYNEKVKVGSKKVKAKPKLSNETTLKTDAWKSTKISSPAIENLFKKESEKVKDEWFEYSKKVEEKRGKSPLEAYKQHTKDEKTFNIFIRSTWKETENKKDAELENYKVAYRAAYELGMKIGSELGNNFLSGLKTALKGSTPSTDDYKKPYFSEGYKAGKREAGFKNLSGSVLSALGLGDNEWSEKQALSKNDNAYSNGYSIHFNSWHKIFLVKNALSVPEELNETNLDLLKNLEKDSDNETSSAEDTGAYQLALLQIKNKESIKTSALKTELKNMDNAFQSDAEKFIEKEISSGDEDAENKNYLVQSKKNILAKKFGESFKLGYDAAYDAAESKVNTFIDEKTTERKGFIVGYSQSGAELQADTLSEDLQSLVEAAKRAEEPQELVNLKSYQKGKTRGYLLGIQVAQGLKNAAATSSALEAPENTNAVEKGKKEGNAAANEFKSQMLGKSEIANEIKSAIESDTYKNLSPDQKVIFVNAYDTEIALAKSFIEGYKDAVLLANNDNPLDDYRFLETPDSLSKSVLNAEYQKGFLEGRSAALVGKIAGTDDSAVLLKNISLSNKLGLMRETMGGAYTETYKKGWEQGQKKGKEITSADIIGVGASAEKDGANGMPDAILEQVDKLVKSFVEETISKARLNGESGDEQKNKYSLFLSLNNSATDILKSNDSSFNKVEQIKFITEQTLFAIDKPLEADKKTFKILKDQIKQNFKELPDAYNIGYKEALSSGIRTAEREKSSNSSSRSDNFYNEMIAAISVKTDTFYIKGYSDATKQIMEMNRSGQNPSVEEMNMSKSQLPIKMVNRLQQAIEAEYKEFVKNPPTANSEELYENFKYKRNNYKSILKNLNAISTEKVEPQMNIDEYINNQINNIFKNLKGLCEGMQEDSAFFFKNKIDENWRKIADNYQKGFSNSLPLAVNDCLQKRDALNSTSQGLNNFLDYLHDQIEEGKIKDANVSDIDFLDHQLDFIHQIYLTRASIDKEEHNIINLDDEISDLNQELGYSKVRLSDVEFELDNLTDASELESFFNEKNMLEEYSKELIFKIFDKKAELNIANEIIDEQTDDFLNFTREEISFVTNNSNFSTVRTYLIEDDSQLQVRGHFNDSVGNAKIEGPGKLTVIDSEERIKYESDISLGLGSVKLDSKSLEVFEQEFYVQLRGGLLSLPINGKVEIIDFDLLDLEMGLSLLQQLNTQLQLGDLLQKGNVISSGSLSSGSSKNHIV